MRFLPHEPFPAYAFTPGRDPHPVRDPRGHSFGVHAPPPPRPDPADWRASHDYLRGIDLFNAGYYWEAHEAWEGLWNASGRDGAVALMLQALIALAAAGLKRRGGSTSGTAAHASRARSLLSDVLAETGPRFMGLDLQTLRDAARAIPCRAPAPGLAVLGIELLPG